MNLPTLGRDASSNSANPLLVEDIGVEPMTLPTLSRDASSN
jgi:hypothetical protein